VVDAPAAAVHEAVAKEVRERPADGRQQRLVRGRVPHGRRQVEDTHVGGAGRDGKKFGARPAQRAHRIRADGGGDRAEHRMGGGGRAGTHQAVGGGRRGGRGRQADDAGADERQHHRRAVLKGQANGARDGAAADGNAEEDLH